MDDVRISRSSNDGGSNNSICSEKAQSSPILVRGDGAENADRSYKASAGLKVLYIGLEDLSERGRS